MVTQFDVVELAKSNQRKKRLMARHSERVVIPRSGIKISRLGLGTAPLSGSVCFVSEEDRQAGIKFALESGISYIDTAPLYGFGSAEQSIGKVMQSWSGAEPTISTKAGRLIIKKDSEEGRIAAASAAPALSPFHGADESVMPVFDFSRDGMFRSVEESLKRLNRTSLDIALIHDPDDRIDEAIRTAYPAMMELKSQGVIKTLGVGVNYVDIALRCVREMELDILLIAGRYSLLDQSAGKELFVESKKRNLAVSVAGVFNSGVLARPQEEGTTFHYVPANPEVVAKAKKIGELFNEFGVSLTAAALQYPIQNSAVTAVIAGCRNPEEITNNIEDFNSDIPKQAWEALSQSGLVENYESLTK